MNMNEKPGMYPSWWQLLARVLMYVGLTCALIVVCVFLYVVFYALIVG